MKPYVCHPVPVQSARHLACRLGVVIGLCAITLTAGAPVSAATTAQLIGPDLNVQPINVTSLRGGTLHYFDEQRNLRSGSVDRFVQLRAIGGEGAVVLGSSAMVYLVDGQRFAGSWVGATPDGLGLRWRHPSLGVMTVMLEDLARVVWRANSATRLDTAHETPASDTVVLTNGDELTGFISRLTNQGLTLTPNEGGAAFDVPLDRVAYITLANPARNDNPLRHRVSLVDGTRVFADPIELTGDRALWTMIPPGSPARDVDIPIADLVRIDFQTGGLRLVDLTDLPMRTTQEPKVFGLAIPVRVEGRSVRMHAPGEVVFDLPAGAVRFAAVAKLDRLGDPPADMAKWSDFQIVLRSDNTDPKRYRVSGDTPTVRLNVPVAGGVLTIRLDPAVNGPILDRLLLTDPVVLVRLPGEATTGGRDR